MQTNKPIRYIDEHGQVKVKDKKEEIKSSEDFDYAKYLNLGFYLIAPLLLGIFGGLQADNWFKTKPLFVLCGIIFGSVASLYNLYKLTKDA